MTIIISEPTMTQNAETLFQAALQLADDDRVQLAERLFASVDPDGEFDPQWEAELSRRFAEWETGVDPGISWNELKDQRWPHPMAQVLFHRLAAREYKLARSWYAEKSDATAQRFVNEIDRCVQRIAADPECGVRYGSVFRWVRCRRYPYLLYYRMLTPETAYVVAVAHARRRQGYWRGRTQ
jgi:putative addiction module component (TIGR02574 family)